MIADNRAPADPIERRAYHVASILLPGVQANEQA